MSSDVRYSRRYYDTQDDLREACERYFDSISAEETTVDAGGRERTVRVWLEPPLMSELMLALHISRKTWSRYAAMPELADVCEWAKGVVEGWLERQLVLRDKSVNGLVFDLQNNFGWRERTEQELGPETRAHEAALADLSLAQRLDAMRAAARSYTEDMDGDD